MKQKILDYIHSNHMYGNFKETFITAILTGWPERMRQVIRVYSHKLSKEHCEELEDLINDFEK